MEFDIELYSELRNPEVSVFSQEPIPRRVYRPNCTAHNREMQRREIKSGRNATMRDAGEEGNSDKSRGEGNLTSNRKNERNTHLLSQIEVA